MKLEKEENETKMFFYKAEILDNTFQINNQQYHQGFLEYLEQQNYNSTGTIITQGPGKCLCGYLKEQETCGEYQNIA